VGTEAPVVRLSRRFRPSVEELLVRGGDGRLALGETGSNRYGCSVLPDGDAAAFGSSTASTISRTSFEAVARLYRRMRDSGDGNAVLYGRELERVRSMLMNLFGLSKGVEIVFGASGTDLHLIAAQLVSAVREPTMVIVVEAAETGSSVFPALAGRHFSGRAPLAASLTEGASISGANSLDVVSVALRNAHGIPRDVDEVDAEVRQLCNVARVDGQRVLLFMVDVSKTGLLAPTARCVVEMKRSLGDALEVVVDASQGRIAPTTVRTYLRHEFVVALTGSKFYGGPAFSGALLIPPAAAKTLRGRQIPRALRAYSARADWPRGWSAAAGLDDVPNIGLLLRWEAALTEMSSFLAVPSADTTRFIARFRRAIEERLRADHVFEAASFPMLDRQPLCARGAWDTLPTIYPFVLRPPPGFPRGSVLNCEEIAQLHRKLLAAGCHLGQPVAYGSRSGGRSSALRLCLSARLIVEATSLGGRDADRVIERAQAALTDTARLAAEIFAKRALPDARRRVA